MVGALTMIVENFSWNRCGSTVGIGDFESRIEVEGDDTEVGNVSKDWEKGFLVKDVEFATFVRKRWEDKLGSIIGAILNVRNPPGKFEKQKRKKKN